MEAGADDFGKAPFQKSLRWPGICTVPPILKTYLRDLRAAQTDDHLTFRGEDACYWKRQALVKHYGVSLHMVFVQHDLKEPLHSVTEDVGFVGTGTDK